jgi:peptidoglycan/LPS O-acetylase OafA/YrhL
MGSIFGISAGPWILTRTPWSGGEEHWVRAAGVTFAVAAVSFYGLERPLQRFKRRFERIRSDRAEPAKSPRVSP